MRRNEYFFDKGFEEGRWAGELARSLRRRSIISDLTPKARVWRANWKQWIQFEERDWSGPVFWLGKPGIISSKDALYIGYYVERGLSEEESRQSICTITPEWHWHGFIRCINNSNLRYKLNSLLIDLNENRRCIWIGADNIDKRIKYENENSLLEAKGEFKTIPRNIWIDVIIGYYYLKEECLERQKNIITDLSMPIIRAYEIDSLVKDAMSREIA